MPGLVAMTPTSSSWQMLLPWEGPRNQTVSTFSRSFRGRVTLCRSGTYEPRKWTIPIACRNSGTVVGAGMSRMAAPFSGFLRRWTCDSGTWMLTAWTDSSLYSVWDRTSRRCSWQSLGDGRIPPGLSQIPGHRPYKRTRLLALWTTATSSAWRFQELT